MVVRVRNFRMSLVSERKFLADSKNVFIALCNMGFLKDYNKFVLNMKEELILIPRSIDRDAVTTTDAQIVSEKVYSVNMMDSFSKDFHRKLKIDRHLRLFILFSDYHTEYVVVCLL